jgi:hypothetical protein
MWKRKDSLWMPDWTDEGNPDGSSEASRSKENIAPKPHPMTVKLAFLSPTLAIVATVISIWTFVEGQHNTIVGQRAYLYASTPRVVVKEARLHNMYTIWMTYTIKNLGKTPGAIANIRYLYRPIENAAGEAKFRLLRDKDNLEDTDNTSEVIGADQTTVREARPVLATVSEGFGLDPLGRKGIVPFPIHVIGILTYNDVFNKSQTYKWCWIPVVNQTLPSTCDPSAAENIH